MHLAADQSHQQGFITCLFGAASDRRGFGGRPEGIGGRGSQGGELLRHRFLSLAGRSLARLLLWFWLRFGQGPRLCLVERLGIGCVVGEFLRLRGRRWRGGVFFWLG